MMFLIGISNERLDVSDSLAQVGEAFKKLFLSRLLLEAGRAHISDHKQQHKTATTLMSQQNIRHHSFRANAPDKNARASFKTSY